MKTKYYSVDMPKLCNHCPLSLLQSLGHVHCLQYGNVCTNPRRCMQAFHQKYGKKVRNKHFAILSHAGRAIFMEIPSPTFKPYYLRRAAKDGIIVINHRLAKGFSHPLDYLDTGNKPIISVYCGDGYFTMHSENSDHPLRTKLKNTRHMRKAHRLAVISPSHKSRYPSVEFVLQYSNMPNETAWDESIIDLFHNVDRFLSFCPTEIPIFYNRKMLPSYHVDRINAKSLIKSIL